MRSPRPAHRPMAVVAATTSLLAVGLAAPASASSPSVSVVCESASVEVPRGEVVEFDLVCTTQEGDPVDGYTVVTAPTKAVTGSFSVNPVTGHVTYRARVSATGADSFTFVGTAAGLADSEVTTAVLDLQNNRPACDGVYPVSTSHDRSVEIDLTCTDADDDVLTLSAGTLGAAHGSLAFGDGTVTYTPATHYVGDDGFSVVAGDGAAFSDEVEVDVSVTNARPVCAALDLVVSHDRRSTVPLECSDADGDDLTPSVSAPAQHGTATVSGGSVRYKPAKHYLGSDTFKVTVTDGLRTSAAARVDLEVTNDRPACPRSDSYTTRGKLRFDFSCTDGDGDDLDVSVDDRPRHGSVKLSGDRVTYVPDLGWTGRDDFALVASDGITTSKVRTVEVKVRSSRPAADRGRLERTRVLLDVSVPGAADDVRGRVIVSFDVGRRTVDVSGRFSVAAGDTEQISLGLDPADRRLVRRMGARRVHADVVLVHDDFAGREDRHRHDLVLKNNAR